MRFAEFACNDSDELIAAQVTHFSGLAAEFESNRMYHTVVVLDVDPHILIILLIHYLALLDDAHELCNSGFHAAFVQYNAGFGHYGREHSGNLGGRAGVTDAVTVETGDIVCGEGHNLGLLM